ncbi:MAG: HIT domain-containing protein [Candidatus Aenigmatarchaeota archaeon]
MEQKDCVFCKIANKQIPAFIIYEDENSTAFLDLFPRSRGMAIVIPKTHYKIFDENFELSKKVFSSVLIVSEMIKQALEPKSISISVITSEEIPHFHFRIYPVYEENVPLIESTPIKITEDELKRIAEKIKSIRIEIKEEGKEEKKIEEKKIGKEEAFWMRRSMEIG